MPATDLPVGSVDLDHSDPGLGQVTGQPGPVGPGALDPDGLDGTERRQERQQPPVADRGRGERVGAQHRTEVVAGGGDVDVGVGIHATDDSDGT